MKTVLSEAFRVMDARTARFFALYEVARGERSDGNGIVESLSGDGCAHGALFVKKVCQ